MALPLHDPGAMRLCVAVFFVVVSLVGGHAGCGGGEEREPEDCALTGDEDGNGLADCSDLACAEARACLPACGNARVDAGERCDDGNRVDGDGCDQNCTPTACGNGVLTRDEGCDDGNTVSGDGCDRNCVVTGCGNGVTTAGEACDDGNTVSGDGCDNNCTATACGNGVMSGGEACDDGNATDGDGCDSNCTATACGNGIVTGTEGCDDGNATSGDGCDSNCTVTACGNGVPAGTEGCDDGNAANGDGCDANCTVTGCGNGIVTGAEVCDDGNATNGDGCDNNCTPTGCGNGVRTGFERCDDGNLTSGDGCDANCTLTRCGNGIVTGTEVCDDGNLASGDGCDANCTPTGCGNGIVTGTEGCDDGNATSGDGCDANCTLTGCGNGIVTAPEECDDGNLTEGDGCNTACAIPVCGDGELDVPEACDDGNAASGDGCDANCTPTGCGNGVVTGAEACDDGNVRSLDGCSSTCVIEPLEVEPNEDGAISTGSTSFGNDFAAANADANGAFIGDVMIRGALAPAGDEDVFKLTNPGPSSVVVRLDIWDPARGIGMTCNAGQRTVLAVRDASGMALETSFYRSPVDSCAGLVVGLLPGASVYAHVSALPDSMPVASYALAAVYLPVTCGDGVRITPETCDDGNTSSGDGCHADCQVETRPEAEPNGTLAEAAASPLEITGDTTLTASLVPASDVDLYRIVVSASTVVLFETHTRFYDCASQFGIRLFDAAGALIVTGAKPYPLGASCGSLAIFLEAGTYFLRIEQGFIPPVPQYFLTVDYLTDRGPEPEPPGMVGVNDTPATASPSLLAGNNVYVRGDHTLYYDVDSYSITVPPWARIRAEIIEGDRAAETCESKGIASALQIINHLGRVIETDNGAVGTGRGHCSLIDGTGTFPVDAYAENATGSPQTFTIQVLRAASTSHPTGESFVYRLLVSFR